MDKRGKSVFVLVPRAKQEEEEEPVEEEESNPKKGRNTKWLRRAFKTYRDISQDGFVQQIPTAEDLTSGVEKSLNKRNLSLPDLPDAEDVKELISRDPKEFIPELPEFELPRLENVVEDAKPFLASLADGIKKSFAKRNIDVPKVPTSVEEVRDKAYMVL